MKLHKLTILLLFITFSLVAQDNEKQQLSEAFRLIDVWLDAQKDYDKLPGISTSIVKDQELIWSKGYGQSNPKNRVEAQPRTVYSICSISKLFTSVSIMKLYEEGKLRLDDKIEDLLPWYDLKQAHVDSGPITIRSLLTHSSGLPRESDYPYWSAPDFSFPMEDEIKRKLEDQESLYPASTYFQYSNLGMTLLGEVVSEISGMTYDDFVDKNILTPLKLADTRTIMPESLWGEQLATGHSALKRDGDRDQIEIFHANGIKAAAGFSSTVEDLANFASWQFRLRENGGEEILKVSTLKEMQRVQWIDPDWGTTWGLGFSVYKVGENTMVGHGGSCPGYRSVIMMDNKEKLAFIVMINASGTDPGKYAKGMAGILAEAMKENSEKRDIQVDLEPFAGRYDTQPWSSEMAIVPWEGKLAVLYLPTSDPAKGMTFLKHVEGDTFQRVRKDDTAGEDITFVKDQNGRVTKVLWHSNYYNKIN